MRLNLSLLESAVDAREWRHGRLLLKEDAVKRLVRDDAGAGVRYEVAVEEAEQRYGVELSMDAEAGALVLEEWRCDCLRQDTCGHTIAAAMAVREALERAVTTVDAGTDLWREALEEASRGRGEARKSWICYDLSVIVHGDMVAVGIVRRRRSLSDKGKRSVGSAIGWTPTAVGHFGYKTGDDPAINRDDLIPVLCVVNRHDLRVRTIQPGFVDVFFRLFVDAEPFTLRIDNDDVAVDGSERQLVAIIEDAADGGLRVAASLASHVPGQPAAEHILLPGPVPWVYLRAERCVVRPSSDSGLALRLLRAGALHVPSDEVDLFCRTVLPELRGEVPVIERSAQLPPVLIATGRPIIKLSEVDSTLLVALAFAYEAGDTGELEFDAGQGSRVFSTSSSGGRQILWLRDEDLEDRWTQRVCLAIAGALPARLGIDEALDFLLDQLPALIADGAEVRGREDLLLIVANDEPVEPIVRVSSGIDWFGLGVTFTAGDERIDMDAVIQAWRSGLRHVRLSDGRLARLPAAWLKRNLAALTDLRELATPDPENPGAWRIPTFLMPVAAALAEGEATADNRWNAFLLRIGRFEKIETVPLPKGLNAELRGYQHHGYDWLCALRDLGLHGCLADDMGLGKTVQALAMICADVESGRAGGRPTLVVAPTSVVQNWESEAARFVPGLKTVALRADDRAARMLQLDTIESADIVLTSYALLRQDLERLRAIPLHFLVLDEAQAIKNPSSKTAKAACEMDARHRFTLTGTPLENNLLELWSQMHFLMPGFFGSRARFVRRYGALRSAGASPAAVDQLRARLRPFILRRMKTDVDTELPPITEVVLRCTMGDAQRKLYDQVRTSMRAKIAKLVDDVGVDKAALGVLEALLRLRQTCCHPRLLPFDEARAVTESAKTILFMDTLRQLVAEGRRVLVFSQWTTMLGLLRAELDDIGITYTYMDGSTRDRGKVIQSFQDPDGPPLFLISLKAGGVGLNLTAADTVIHYDPWWNPAAEQQASDRAHRIGQDKPVLVLKMVVSDSVEERILKLQAEKKGLARAAIDTEVDGIKKLSRSDLMAILE